MKTKDEMAKDFRDLMQAWKDMKEPADPRIQSAGDCAGDLECLLEDLGILDS